MSNTTNSTGNVFEDTDAYDLTIIMLFMLYIIIMLIITPMYTIIYYIRKICVKIHKERGETNV